MLANCYFGRLNTVKMKIRGVMARKGDTPEYVNRMQREVFEILAEARSLKDLRGIEPKARKVYRRYLGGLDDADVKELAIHGRVSKLNYSRKCISAGGFATRPIRERSNISPRSWSILVIAPSINFKSVSVPFASPFSRSCLRNPTIPLTEMSGDLSS
ncbi:MAG: hypothetical protein ABR985_16925 [Methanotrichaceae archaeon]|jgi:DNA polymerase elongation subunit (family B)